MAGRHTGRISYWNEADDYGEIACPGMGPVGVDGADLRRIGAATVGTVVDFELGVMSGRHYPASGATNVTRPTSWSDVANPPPSQ